MRIEENNDYLERMYGRHVSNNMLKWRVIYSKDQMMHVYETYEDITEGGIYLGTKTGWRDKPKYWYLPECFIFEKLCFADSVNTEDMLGGGYSYEPVLPFLDGNDQPIQPQIKFIQYFMKNYLSAERRVRDLKAEEAVKLEKEIEFNRNLLYESPVTDKLAYGEGIVVPSNYEKVN